MTAGLSAVDRARIEEISRLARGGAVEELVELLAEPSWAVRRSVVACLARIGSAVELLCAELVGDRSHEARLSGAVEALSASNGDADEAVLRLIGEGQSQAAVLCDAAQILGRRQCTRAVPSLARLMVSEDRNVAAAAAEALGRIGGAGTVEPLIVAVESRDFFRIFPAISPLGHSADPRSIPPLVTLLSEPRYAAEAAEALGHSAHLTAALPLMALLVNVDGDLVRAAAGALTRLRIHREMRFDEELRSATAAPFAAAARSRLRGCRKDGSAADRIALTMVLGWLNDDDAIAELVESFLAPTDDVASVATALSDLGSMAEPRLHQALRDGDSAQRLRLMAIIKPTRAGLAVFVACLDDAEPRVRAQACQALSRIGSVAAVAALFRFIGDANAYVSQAAVGAIQSLGSVEAKALAIEAARSSDPRRRRAALRILGYFGFPEGLELMVEALSDADERIRDAAINGLPFIEDPRALVVLLEASESPAPRTRATAMRALGQTAAQGAAPAALSRGIRDDDAWVRYYACQALGKLGIGATLDDVIALIDDPAGQVRVAAIEAIAKLGNGRATAVLDGACRSPDPDIRRAAILGLGGCKAAEALPILLREACSEDSTTRLFALAALSEIDSSEATEALVRATLDPVLLVRNAARASLSARPGPEAARWLIAQLLEPEGRSAALAALQSPIAGRFEAITAALQIAEPPLASLLITALAHTRAPAGLAAVEAAMELDNVHARRSAALALTELDGSASQAILDRAKLEDPDDEVRRICAAALR